MELVLMIVIITWGTIVTIVIIGVEWSHIERFNEITRRIIKLENKLEHGKETEKGKESEASKGTRSGH